MAETLELITIKDACELLNISRDTFYRVLKGRVVQIPTLSREGKYDKESVIKEYSKYKKHLSQKNNGIN